MGASPHRSFVDVVRARASVRAERPTYTYLGDGPGEAWTLDDAALDLRARALAARLQAQGARGERVLILLPPGLPYVVAFYGCLYAGSVAVPAYPPGLSDLGRSLDRIAAVASDAGARFAVSAADAVAARESALAGRPGLLSLRWIAADGDAGWDAATSWEHPGLGPDDVAFLQYTSGSTGRPKGVMISHGNLIHNCGVITEAFGCTPADSHVCWLPPYHDMGLVGGILWPMHLGIPVTLFSPLSFLKRPVRWVQAISQRRATVTGAPNFAYDLVARKVDDAQRRELDLSRLRVACTAAEPVRPETMERFARAFAACGFEPRWFFPTYGLAESTLMATGGRRRQPPVVRRVSREGLRRRRVAPAAGGGADAVAVTGCGRGRRGHEVRIVDPDTRALCAPDAVGEIWLRGPSVARGYWESPEQTRRIFAAELAPAAQRAAHPGPFCRTGDLGFFADGELFVTGRLKDVVIVKGRNYHPEDLEADLEACHPELRRGSGAVVAVDAGGSEGAGVVYELATPGADLEALAGAIRRTARERHELELDAVLLLRARTIPKTTSGKIQRHACRDLIAQPRDERVLGAWASHRRRP